MPSNSRLGTQLGFQLGATAFLTASATSVVIAQGFCFPVNNAVVPALGVVFTSGRSSAVGSRISILGAQLGFMLGAGINVREAHPNSVLSVVHCSNFVASVNLSVLALGIVRNSGSAPQSLSTHALGKVVCQGFTTPDVRQIGAHSIVQTQGSCTADISVTAKGVVQTQGGVAATIAVLFGTAKGITNARGSISSWSIKLPALGIVHTQGMGTIALSADCITCLEGPSGPISVSKLNFAL